MQKVRMKESLSNGTETWDSGTEYEMPASLAESWIASGVAEAVDAPEKTKTPASEQPKPRKRR